jgi:hypothetical protein
MDKVEQVGHRVVNVVTLLCIACTAVLAVFNQLPGGQ